MLPLTLAEIAAACDGRLEGGDPRAVVGAVRTDSRRSTSGALFVGLRGDNFDGDAYAAQALAAGAAAVMVRAATAAGLPGDAPRIVVDDGLAALQRLATEVRRRAGVKVVAITGSAGKTSTKDILAALLRPVARTVATSANLNNEIGVPLTLLAIEQGTEVVVVEMAMRGHGQIRELARIALPDIGVITNIAPVHLELVGTVDDVATAKAELIDELHGGTAVVPAPEPLLDRHVSRFRGRVITFGAPEADVHFVAEERRGAGTHVLVDAFGHRGTLDFSFTGSHYLQDALAALAAFMELGYRLDEAKRGAAQVAFSDLRGAVSELPGGGLLLNDAYNANPVAMVAAVDHLVSIAAGRPTVAVLGDMYELGAGADAFHRVVGEHCAAADVRVVAVGELARSYLTGAAGERWFPGVDECIAALPGLAPAGSAVLVKASRLLRLERVAEALAAGGLASPADGSTAAGSPATKVGDDA
ncbi:MAG: UDP-N-acetylmuramoyl-tripeptide--D-alanyl-D-alanine ligase [Actinobacteria bacterium]|nr:UDP-N-acetylmuramoyl-tripeptide--D-alanyl-D-alanine ligase [Actinomycetota bacterium]